MTHARSYLFVPADSARKINKAYDGAADAIIMDLEDSVAADQKSAALATAQGWLAELDEPSSQAPQLWVRLNTADSRQTLHELASLDLQYLTGLVYPKLQTRDQLAQMDHWLAALETRDGLAVGSTGIIGIITENAASLVSGHSASLARGHPRLQGYSWGMEDLSAAIGRPPLPGQTRAGDALAEAVQRHCLLMAAAAGVQPIDSISTVLHDDEALARETRFARELGFSGKLAIHPAQLAPIHDAVMPTQAALDWARRVCEISDRQPTSSAFQLDGRMIDQPHIKVARQIMQQHQD